VSPRSFGSGARIALNTWLGDDRVGSRDGFGDTRFRAAEKDCAGFLMKRFTFVLLISGHWGTHFPVRGRKYTHNIFFRALQ
jgi:hypothetical protein